MAVTTERGNYKTFEIFVRAFSCVSWTNPKIAKQKKGKPACCLPLIAAPYSTNLNIYLHRFSHTNP
jgi:hypothetical protein